MKKMLLMFVVLCGCSANNQWSKIDGTAYDVEQLNVALDQCDYKSSMRRSNELMLSSSTATSNAELSVETLDDPVKLENINKKNRQIETANKNAKKDSMNLAKQAYQCMQNKGFSRT